MSLYNIVGTSSLQAGQPEDVSQVLANFQAIQTILNGGIDDANVRSTAAIQVSKLALPNDKLQFLRGDAFTKGGMTLLYDTSDASVVFPAASITTPSLDQSFAHLMIAWSAKSSNSGLDTLGVRYNGDATANYVYNTITGVNSTPGASATISNSFIAAGFVSQNNGFDAAGVIFIPNYSAAGFVPLTALSYAENSSTGPVFELTVMGGLRKTAAAVTTLTFLCQTGNILTGRFSVYGIPG